MIRDTVLLAVEDSLSEAVGRVILQSLHIGVAQTIGLKGNDYLKKKTPALNIYARHFPVLLLTDLDVPTSCPPELIREWLKHPIEPSLLFRVAVTEVESWIMADREAFAKFLSISRVVVPRAPDELPQPKEKIVFLSRSSGNRAVRDDMLPARGSTAPVGRGYNARLGEFVRAQWDPARAARLSPSLARALSAIQRFRDR